MVDAIAKRCEFDRRVLLTKRRGRPVAKLHKMQPLCKWPDRPGPNWVNIIGRFFYSGANDVAVDHGPGAGPSLGAV